MFKSYLTGFNQGPTPIHDSGQVASATPSPLLSTCNRAKCICLNKSSLVAYRLTYKDSQQKTRSVYVKKDHLPRMQKMIANYALLKELIEELVEINIEVFKNESRQ